MLVDGISFIKNGEIDISEDEWKHLNKRFTPSELIAALSEAIAQTEVPLRDISFKEAVDDFAALCQLDSMDLWKSGETFTKYSYKYQITDRYIDACTTGNKAADYFHQEARYKCDSLNAPSPYRVWNTEKFRNNMLKNLWTMETKKVDAARLRSAMGLRNYVASQFRPSAAKAVIEIFGAKDVLDFSSGWGDRLAGFYASQARSYVGIDPNMALIHGYADQQKMYSRINGEKSVEMVIGCAEDVELHHGSFDLVFTSPPYFDIERYSHDETQSWKRYKKLEVWLESFLFKAVSNAWSALRYGGMLAVNIADVYGHHRVNVICDPMNDFISTLHGAEYQGALGYRLAKRPNSLSDREGTYIEPIWVWRKTF